jgi:glycosyltransferase involved in cell wall biosynthesis
MSAERIIALLGRRDEPTDGVADYCTWLGRALMAHGYELETVRVPWFERGWSAALAELRAKAGAWRGHWVLLQYTTLGWSSRGFPRHVSRILSILRSCGVQCAVVYHDFSPNSSHRLIDRARRFFQLRALKSLYQQAERNIFTVSMDKIPWLAGNSRNCTLIPVGANFPEISAQPGAFAGRDSDHRKTVAIFSVTGGPSTAREVADIGAAVRRASTASGPLRLLVMGRGSKEAEPALRAEFLGTSVDIEVLGLLSAEEMTRALSRADVQLFVRDQISSRRGSAIAAIACGLPVVCYSGPETAWPITEAGILAVPLGNRAALSQALEAVLQDDRLRESLAARSRNAQAKYFSWQAIAAQFVQCLRAEESAKCSLLEKAL